MTFFFTMFEIGTSEIQASMAKNFLVLLSLLQCLFKFMRKNAGGGEGEENEGKKEKSVRLLYVSSLFVAINYITIF